MASGQIHPTSSYALNWNPQILTCVDKLMKVGDVIGYRSEQVGVVCVCGGVGWGGGVGGGGVIYNIVSVPCQVKIW